MQARTLLFTALLLATVSMQPVRSNSVVIAPAPFQAQSAGYIVEFPVPTNNSGPYPITVDPDGTVWFTESNTGNLTRFDPQNQTFTSFPIQSTTPEFILPPNASRSIISIAAAPNGNLWFTIMTANAIGRFNATDRSFTYYNITKLAPPHRPAIPFGITVDPNGIVWVAESGASRIGRLDPADGSFLEYSLPQPNETPYEIFVDQNQSLWITSIWYTSTSPQSSGSRLTRLNPSTGEMKPFELSTWGVRAPVGVAVDSNGRAWIGDHGGSWLVEVNTFTGDVKLHRSSLPPLVPNPQNPTDRVFRGATFSLVNDVVLGVDGTPWFIEHIGGRIGHYVPSTGTMIEYNIPTLTPITLWLAADQTRGMWFTETVGNKIGYIDTLNSSPRFSVTPTTITATLTPGESSTFSLTVTNTSPSSLDLIAGVENTYDYSGPLTSITLQSGETRTVSIRLDSSRNLPAGDYSTGRLAGLAPVIKVSDGIVNYPITILAVVGTIPWLYVGLGAVVAVLGGVVALALLHKLPVRVSARRP